MLRACSTFQIPAITNNKLAEVVLCEEGGTQALHNQDAGDDCVLIRLGK
jgi:hypothetical protein